MQAPAEALHTVMKGMVSATSFEEAQRDAAAGNTATGPDKVPHASQPTVLIAAQGGQAVVAGQDIQMVAQELIHLASGRNTEQAAGGALRIHTGQAIGMLAGAVEAGRQPTVHKPRGRRPAKA